MTEDQALDRIREIVYGQPIGSRVSTGWMTGLQRKHVRTVEEVRDREDGLRRDAIRRAGLDPDEGFGPEVAQSAPIDLLADSTEEMVQAVRDYVWNEFGVALMPEVRP